MTAKKASTANLSEAAAREIGRMGETRDLISKFIRARIAELRVQNDALALGKRKTTEIRGRIAELRELHGKLYPEASAIVEEDADRAPIY